MRSTSIALATLTGMALVISIFSVSQADEGTDGIRTELKADDLAIVLSGESIYQAQCAACHGANLEGQPEWRTRDANGFLPAPPHDESGHTWHHADDLLFEITKYGPAVVIGDNAYQSNMPGYKELLTDDEIVAVLSYIKHTWPEEQRSWQEQVNESQKDGFKPIEKKATWLEKLLK